MKTENQTDGLDYFQKTDGRLRELALFAGDGGGILGGLLCGWRTVGAVEINPDARETLVARQNDGSLEPFPIWDDVCTFNGRLWRGCVDVVSAGFPCTDVSPARTNSKSNGARKGIAGSASGLWREAKRIYIETGAKTLVLENSPHIRTLGLVTILQELAEMGLDAKWGCFSPRLFRADHERKRFFLIANPHEPQCKGGRVSSRIHQEDANPCRTDWWENQPGLERVAHGMPRQMVRLKAIGNRQVPAVVKLAWETLK